MNLIRRLVTVGTVTIASFQLVEAAEWQMHPKDTSASLAATNRWELISSSAMSWSDGRQLLMTFWQFRFAPSGEKEPVRVLVRCHDYFAANMTSTGAVCYIPVEDQ